MCEGIPVDAQDQVAKVPEASNLAKSGGSLDPLALQISRADH